MNIVRISGATTVLGTALFAAGCAKQDSAPVNPGPESSHGHTTHTRTIETKKPNEVGEHRFRLPLKGKEFDLVKVLNLNATLGAHVLKELDHEGLLKTDKDRNEATRLASNLEKNIQLFMADKKNNGVLFNISVFNVEHVEAAISRAADNDANRKLLDTMEATSYEASCFIGDLLERNPTYTTDKRPGAKIQSAFNREYGFPCYMKAIKNLGGELIGDDTYRYSWLSRELVQRSLDHTAVFNQPHYQKVTEVALSGGAGQ